MRVHLSRPDITDAEIEAVIEVLKTPNLSLGPKLGEFEQAFADYIGIKRAVAVNSGTSALYLCLQAMGIGAGDEVITTPFTFIATSNSVMMVGAKPVFVDIDPDILNINPEKIEAAITNKTKAIIPVEAFGSPAGFDRICEIADEYNISVLEDSCEALGSALNGKMAGTFGKMSTFAFYPNKQITTGEGGIILTNDDALADHCCALRNQGRGKHSGWLGHEMLGYNYRLSDINCAIGIVQLSRIEEIKSKRKASAALYQEALADEDRIILPKEPPGCDINWFVFVIRLTDGYTIEDRNEILESMRVGGVQVGNYFTPAHLQPFMVEQFGFSEGDFPITEHVSHRTIALPFYNNLTAEDVGIVAAELKDALDKIDK
ncbi:MAG: DegT/DnrJ/EryC1/StrS family aminotransferase [Sedimentisphaerales bacterium]|nr:DegT/DnrJ/EryC1/StrS family aminotransferase [Sedimentisphaerales bacterium]